MVEAHWALSRVSTDWRPVWCGGWVGGWVGGGKDGGLNEVLGMVGRWVGGWVDLLSLPTFVLRLDDLEEDRGGEGEDSSDVVAEEDLEEGEVGL